MTGVSPSGEILRIHFSGARWFLERTPPRELTVEAPEPEAPCIRWRCVFLPIPHGAFSGERDGVRVYTTGDCEIAGVFFSYYASDITTPAGIRVIRQGNKLWCFDQDKKVRLILRRWKNDIFGSEIKWAVYVPEVCPREHPHSSDAGRILPFIRNLLVLAFILYLCLAFWPVVICVPGMIGDWIGTGPLYDSDAPSLE
jgi:hypothetical protein